MVALGYQKIFGRGWGGFHSARPPVMRAPRKSSSNMAIIPFLDYEFCLK